MKTEETIFNVSKFTELNVSFKQFIKHDWMDPKSRA